MRLALAIPALSCAALAACAMLSGADDLVVVAPPEDAGGDSNDAAAPPPVVDDGGGLQPIACGTGVCVPTGDGWSPVLRPPEACPVEWATRTVYHARDTITCSCDCQPNGGSCEGPLIGTTGTGFTCSGESAQLPPLPGDGSCVAAEMPTIPPGASFQIVAAPVDPPTSCTPTPVAERRPAEVALCSGGPASPSAECSPAESCIARPSRSTQLCVLHDGDVECPSRFSRKTLITTGSIDDTRDCSTCECDVDCNGGTLEGYVTTTCMGLLGSVRLGTCRYSGATTGESFRYRAGSGCRTTKSSTVTGTVTLLEPQTLCCARDDDDDDD